MLPDVFIQHGAEVVQFLKRQIHLLEKCNVLGLGIDADALVQTLPLPRQTSHERHGFFL